MFAKNTMFKQQTILQKSVTQSMIDIQMMEFSKFRKRIGLYSYKLTKNNRFKNPHAMPLHQRQQYQAQGYRGEVKIREVERNSDRPFGYVSNKGRFQFNIEKVPFYNIPDLTGFKVIVYALLSYYVAETLCCTYHSKDK